MVVEKEGSRKSKQRKAVELQYCYEPEMEGIMNNELFPAIQSLAVFVAFSYHTELLY